MSVSSNPLVGVVMGSSSDWRTMECASKTLTSFDISHETRIISAHRTPHLLMSWASEVASRGIKVIIAGAGGAAHLPGMIASVTHLPVIGVPVDSQSLKGVDSLLSIVQMPAGVPVATMAIGSAGATNAALLAASILSLGDPVVARALQEFRTKQTQDVLNQSFPPPSKD